MDPRPRSTGWIYFKPPTDGWNPNGIVIVRPALVGARWLGPGKAHYFTRNGITFDLDSAKPGWFWFGIAKEGVVPDFNVPSMIPTQFVEGRDEYCQPKTTEIPITVIRNTTF